MKLLRRLHYFLNRRKREAELAEEMEFHQAMSGRAAMGHPTLAREDARAVWFAPWLQSIVQDLTYALRSFRRQPGFTAIAVIALASAIGLNTSLFTVFNAVALQPWSVRDPGRLVRIFSWEKNPPRGMDNSNGFSLAEMRYLREHARTLSGIFAERGEGGLHLNQSKIRVEYVTADYFRILGLDFDRGRGFMAEEDNRGAPASVAVLSYAAWQNRFAGDPEIVGRVVNIEEKPFTVVGVTPESFRGTTPETNDIWVPMSAMGIINGNERWVRGFLESSQSCCSDLTGRLAAGVTREQARAELEVLSIGFRKQSGQSGDGVVVAGTAMLDRPGRKAREIYSVFGLMFAGVMMVLLLACANVGNLLLARAAARRREIGIRLSMGAGRPRMVRQLLTESSALALLAGGLGVTMAYVLPRALVHIADVEISFRLIPDAFVLVFTLALAALACLVFGLAPALHATRGNFNDAMRRRGTRLPLRSFLLALQVALSVVLLVGTGLLTRGIERARSQDPGFRVAGVASVSLQFPARTYAPSSMTTFYQELIGSLPERAGVASTEPLSGTRGFTGFKIPGRKDEEPVLTNSVSPEYFDVLRIPIMLGRNFAPSDRGRPVVLVNEAFANFFLKGANPIGKNLVIFGPHEIVGVVRNAHTWDLDRAEPAIYTPASFGLPPRLLLRDTPANLAAVEAALKRLDPRVHMEVRPLSENLNRWLSTSRMGATIAGVLGLLALALATIGVAGVYHYAVQQRTEEIGVRMALGARPRQVIALVLGSSARPLACGLAVGLAAAIGASRLIQQYLFGLSRLDFVTYAAVVTTLAAAGLAATFLPARRAMRVDPVRALHYE